jgi:hypothetical protein
MEYNRIKLDGTWYHIPELSEYALSRVHSETYQHGHVYQIRFGNAVLELTRDQAIGLGTLLTIGTEDDHNFPR